jgi:hypothetical protein
VTECRTQRITFYDPRVSVPPDDSPTAGPAEKANRLWIASTILLTIAGLVIRLPGFQIRELWRDDAWVALEARAPLRMAAHMGITARGFNGLEALWVHLDPSSATWAQVPILLIAIVLIPLAAYLVTRATGSPVAGLVTAAILAFSPMAITYATRVKQYELDTLLSLLLLTGAIKLVRTDPQQRKLARLCWLGVIAVLLSASTAPVAAVAIGVPLLDDLRRRRRPPNTELLAIAALALVGLVTIYVVATQLPPSLHNYWQGLFPNWNAGLSSGLHTMLYVVRQFCKHLILIRPTLAALLLLAAAVTVVVRDRVVALILLGPLVLALILDVAGISPLGGGRIDMWLYPSVAITAGLALDALAQRIRTERVRLGLTSAAVVGLGVLGFTASHWYYPSSNVRRQIAYIAKHRRPGDQVDVATLAVYTYALYTPERLVFRVDEANLTGFAVRTADSTELLDANGDRATRTPTCTAAQRVWWVSVAPDPSERRLTQCGYRQAAEPIPHLDLWVRNRHHKRL